MNAHQGEHVGQDHDAGPGAADGLGADRHELDHTGHRHEMAVAVGCNLENGLLVGQKYFGRLRVRPGGHVGPAAVYPGDDVSVFGGHAFPAAGEINADETEGNDSHPQQDALGRVHVGHRAQTAQGHIQEHDDRQHPHAHVDREHAVG